MLVCMMVTHLAYQLSSAFKHAILNSYSYSFSWTVAPYLDKHLSSPYDLSQTSSGNQDTERWFISEYIDSMNQQQ